MQVNKELEIENDNYTKQIKQLQNEYDFSINEKTTMENELNNLKEKYVDIETRFNDQRLEYENTKKVQQVAAKLAYAVSGGDDDGNENGDDNNNNNNESKQKNNNIDRKQYNQQQKLLSNVLTSITNNNDLDDLDDDEKEDEDFLRIMESQSNGPLRIPILSLRRTMRQQRSHMNNMKKQLRILENERNELSQNLLHTTSLKEEVNKWKNDFDMINTEYAATKKKQFVLLELLGEKEEQVAELHDNILTMKTMYKQQTNELLNRIELLERG